MEHRFGRYRLVEKLAQGGMAEVWRARQPVVEGVERDVVIKRILPHLANDPDFVQMFLNEARLAARFNHSNIAQIHDVGSENGSYFIAMEYVNGADLGRVMRRAWALGHWIARPLAIRIVACCCEGLHYAHTRTDEAGRPLRVVHRDTSPANILISVDGAVKLADFGIAKAADLVSVTRAGSIKGKFAYMSPEQAMGRPVDARSDLFSVALVLYELLTGIRPLRRESDAETHRAAVECDLQAPSEVSDVPAELDALVMRALAKDPDDRYADVHQFRMALEEFLVEQRWVATSAQIAELMSILFPDGVRPELPPGVSAEPAGLSPAAAGEPPPPPEERDLYGEDEPLPQLTDHGGLREGPQHTPSAGKKKGWTGPPRRLEVLEGPDAGKVLRLDRARVVVGRVSDCQLQLGDRSISRRHLELAHTPEGLLLRDLASGNGTRVNGEDASERLLVHGDVIELGTTRLRYVDETEELRRSGVADEPKVVVADADDLRATADLEAGQARPTAGEEPRLPADEPPPPTEGPAAACPPPAAAGMFGRTWRSLSGAQRKVLGASVGVVVLLAILAALRPGKPAEDPLRQQAELRFAQARSALADGRREEALVHLRAADRLWPGIDTEGLAARARRDHEAALGLREARALIDTGDLDGAGAALARLDPVAAELVGGRRDLELRLADARADALEAKFGEHLAAQRFEPARALVASAPPSRAERLRQALAQAEQQAQRDAAQAAAQAVAAKAEAERRRKAERAAELSALFADVYARIERGDYSRAAIEADHLADQHPGDGEVRDRAQRVRRLVPTFGRTFAEALDRVKKAEWKESLRPLRRARELLAEMGMRGNLGTQLDAQLAEAAIASARLHAAARDYPPAAALYREALQLAPGDGRARQGLEELGQIAQTAYREGQSLKATDPDRAAARFRLVVELARGSDLEEKARTALAELTP